MTVQYNLDVSTSRPWTLFKLLFRWRGSIWKSVTLELFVWLLLFAVISVIYRFVLSKEQVRYITYNSINRNNRKSIAKF
ncbi:hypothetical protein WUBG_16301, partial [Wuchereria bancrofti]